MTAQQSAAGRRRAYFQLQVAAARLRTIADQESIRIAGVTAAQAGAMYVIAQQPGCTQRTLAERLRQRESAVHGMVSRLSAAGLIERNRSGTDARAWAVHLTPRGRDALSAMDAALDTLNEVIDRAVGARSVDAFVDALEAIASIPGHTAPTS